MARLVTRLGALIIPLLLPPGAAATGPRDPFTPPAASAASAPAATDAAPEAIVSGLTGVRLGSAPAALIDGTWVRPGQPVRGALLGAVRIDGAVLRHPDGRSEHLALFPTPASTGTPAATSVPPADTGSVSIRIAQKRGRP
jgi:hypothetical protein